MAMYGNGGWEEPLPDGGIAVAENESLDLGTRNARRWDKVHNAICEGKPAEIVARLAGKELYAALRRTLKQMAKSGVPIDHFLQARGSPDALRSLVKKAKGHDYAQLLADTAVAEKSCDWEGVIRAFVENIRDKVFDQLLVHSNGDRTLVDGQICVNEAAHQLEPDIQRIARNLANNPTWVPKLAGKRGSVKVNPTEEMLPMSLIKGIQNP
jgi:hypothetical protein